MTPDIDDKIYDRDAPNIAQYGATICAEKYLNLRQWIEWNDEMASDQYIDWSWKGKWCYQGTPERIILKEVSGAHIDPLPDTAEGCE